MNETKWIVSVFHLCFHVINTVVVMSPLLPYPQLLEDQSGDYCPSICPSSIVINNICIHSSTNTKLSTCYQKKKKKKKKKKNKKKLLSSYHPQLLEDQSGDSVYLSVRPSVCIGKHYNLSGYSWSEKQKSIVSKCWDNLVSQQNSVCQFGILNYCRLESYVYCGLSGCCIESIRAESSPVARKLILVPSQ